MSPVPGARGSIALLRQIDDNRRILAMVGDGVPVNRIARRMHTHPGRGRWVMAHADEVRAEELRPTPRETIARRALGQIDHAEMMTRLRRAAPFRWGELRVDETAGAYLSQESWPQVVRGWRHGWVTDQDLAELMEMVEEP